MSAVVAAAALAYCEQLFDADLMKNVAERGAQPPPWISFSSVFVMYLGSVAFAFFTRSVFRRREAWARWLVAAILIGLVAGLAGSLLLGDWTGGDPIGNPWYWPKWACGTAPLVWMGAEGFSHYVKARQRRKLGLCEPLACNRYLLWGLAGVLWAVLEFVVIGQDAVYQHTGAWSGSVGLGGLLARDRARRDDLVGLLPTHLVPVRG